MNTYQYYTYNSPFLIKRWLHQKRIKEAIKILDLKSSDTLLDYGCGDGYLLALCLEFLPPENLYGYEPTTNVYQQAIGKVNNKPITLVPNIYELYHKKFSKIVCLEICEHLPDKELIELLVNIEELMTNESKVVFEVPIEIGIPALIKNTFRFINWRREDNLNTKNYIKTFFGLCTSRKKDQKMANVNYVYSHIGFDHRNFELLLSNYFKIESKQFAPINFLGTLLNNVIYYICFKINRNNNW